MGEGLLTVAITDGAPGFVREDGILTCQGVSLEALAREFGTPLYVYDLDAVAAAVRRFQRAFAGVPLLIAYSVKANGSLGLLNRIGALGAGADIVSRGELERALRAGIPANRIVFAGVGKTQEEMVAGLGAGIRAFHVESEGELELLAEAAGREGTVAPVALRVNPDIDSPTPHEYTRTGHATSKFGIPVRTAEALYQKWADDRRISFEGIDLHIGSQIVEVEPYLHALDTALGMVERLREAGVPLRYLDLGGGFGVGYDGEAGIDLEVLAARVVPRVKGHGLELVLEPGRSIVGAAGVLLTELLYVKEVPGKAFLVTDGGMTELLRPSHYGGYHRITPVRERPGAPRVKADVVGPICESGDFLARDRDLALPEIGDVLAVETSGAYGFAMASNYNARRRPAEIMIENGAPILIRARESIDDLMRGELVPE